MRVAPLLLAFIPEEAPVRVLLCLPIAAAVLLSGGGARAEGYRPQSLTACQATALSTADNAGCFATEIDRLAVRLPSGSTQWMDGTKRSCNSKFERDGTAGIGMAMNCILQAVATRVGASREAAHPTSRR